MEYNKAMKIIRELFPKRKYCSSNFDKENISNLRMRYRHEKIGYADKEGNKVPYVLINENWEMDSLATYETNKVRRYTVTRIDSVCPRINDCYVHTPFRTFKYDDCDSSQGDIVLQTTKKDVFKDIVFPLDYRTEAKQKLQWALFLMNFGK